MSLQTLATVPMLPDQLVDQASLHMVRRSVTVHLTGQAGGLSPSLLADYHHHFWQLSLTVPDYLYLAERPLATLAAPPWTALSIGSGHPAIKSRNRPSL